MELTPNEIKMLKILLSDIVKNSGEYSNMYVWDMAPNDTAPTRFFTPDEYDTVKNLLAKINEQPVKY